MMAALSSKAALPYWERCTWAWAIMGSRLLMRKRRRREDVVSSSSIFSNYLVQSCADFLWSPGEYHSGFFVASGIQAKANLNSSKTSTLWSGVYWSGNPPETPFREPTVIQQHHLL
eukprot:scaffold248438_cov104-Cyclotella_meneghiniana.AAC.6